MTVSDLARSRTFYRAALAPLGFGVVMDLSYEHGRFAGTGFGANGRPQFWIGAGERSGAAVHVAFVAADRAAVDAFHAAAVAAGVTDNGAPGLRPHFHPNYHGAFVLDLDGNNIEAACHAPA